MALFWTHLGKGPADRKGDNISNMVFSKVLSGSIVMNTWKHFANTLSTISCLYLPKDNFLEEQAHVTENIPIPKTIPTHKVSWTFSSNGVPCNVFLTWVMLMFPFSGNSTVCLRSQRKWSWWQHMLLFSERASSEVKRSCSVRFVRNGFTLNAFYILITKIHCLTVLLLLFLWLKVLKIHAQMYLYTFLTFIKKTFTLCQNCRTEFVFHWHS